MQRASRNENEQEFDRDRLLFQRAADSAADGIILVDLQRRITYLNPARARMHGYEVQELIGRDVSVLTQPPSRAEEIAAEVVEMARWEGESTGLRKDGSAFPMWQSISRIDDAAGNPLAMLSITRDVTDAQRYEQSLKRSTSQLTDLLEVSRELNSALDTDQVLRLLVQHGMYLVSASAGTAGLYVEGRMRFREYNRRGALMPIDFSFRPGHGVPGWIVEHRLPYVTNDAEHDPQVIAHVQKSLGFRSLIDVPIISSDDVLLGCLELHNFAGEKEFTDEDVGLLTGLANQAAVALNNAVLAENLRKYTEEIKKNEETLRLVVEGSPDFFFYVHDASGVFTYLSSSVENITGHSVEDWRSHYTRFMTDNPINDKAIDYTEKTLKTGQITPSYPVEVYHKNGRRIMLEVYERPVIEDGKVVGIRGVARDVTELRRVEAAQRQLQQESEQHKRKFYRDTIFAVTDGKLLICDPEETELLCDEPLFPTFQVAEPKDIAMVRDEVCDAARTAGMDPSLLGNLALAAGEAATNALKHAGGGSVCVQDAEDAIRVGVFDEGPGMDSLALPLLTLKKGYSTQRSLGMGYATILGLADKVYLSTGPTGTRVVIEMAKQPKPSAVELSNLPDLW